MTRGNQRENDRAKAQAKLAGAKGPKESGSSLKKKQEEGAEIMRLKQAKAEAAKLAATPALTAKPKP